MRAAEGNENRSCSRCECYVDGVPDLEDEAAGVCPLAPCNHQGEQGLLGSFGGPTCRSRLASGGAVETTICRREPHCDNMPDLSATMSRYTTWHLNGRSWEMLHGPW